MQNQAGKSAKAIAAGIITEGAWFHFAGTYDGKVARIYFNGRSGSGGSSGEIPLELESTAFPILIGREGLSGADRTFFGMIDEVRVWNRVLSEEEIQAGMGIHLRESQPGLIGYWSFENGDGSDSSGLGNRGILHGNVEVKEYAFPNVRPPSVAVRSSPAGADFEFEIRRMEQGFAYEVQGSPDLAKWKSFGSPPPSSASYVFKDWESRSFPTRFYRVLLVHPPATQ